VKIIELSTFFKPYAYRDLTNYYALKNNRIRLEQYKVKGPRHKKAYILIINTAQ